MAQGVVGVFKAGLAIGSVMTVAALLLSVADELSDEIMSRTVGGAQQFSDRFASVGNFHGFTTAGPATPIALLLIFGLVGIVVGVILFGEMLFRHALLVVMVAVSPIAAAGMVAGSGAEWWRRHVSAGLRLIFLKPLIVLIFGVSFAVAGQGEGILNILAGLVTLAVAAMAWQLLGKVCTWSAGHAGSGGGVGAFLGGLVGAGAGLALSGRAMSRQSAGSIVESDRATIGRNIAAMDAPPGNSRFGQGSGALALAGGGAYAALRIAAHAKDHLKGGIDQMAGHAGLGADLHAPYPIRYDLGPQYPPATYSPEQSATTTPPPEAPPRPDGA
jgi:hypothetical protein